MKKIGIFSLVAAYAVLFNTAMAIEEQIFNVRGDAPIEVIIEKLGAPKDSSIPLTFKSGEREIKIEVLDKGEKVVEINFNPAHPFTVSDKDLFEKIKIKETGDRVDPILIIADPKSGRIWTLNTELKVFKLELVAPWKSKVKMKSLKEILSDRSHSKIQRNQKKKAEIKK